MVHNMKSIKVHDSEAKTVKVTFSWRKDERATTPVNTQTITFDYSKLSTDQLVFDASRAWVIDKQRPLREGKSIPAIVDVSVKRTGGFQPLTKESALQHLKDSGMSMEEIIEAMEAMQE